MPDIDVKALRALLEAATPGPWSSIDEVVYLPEEVEDGALASAHWEHADATLIAAVRNALPELLDAFERLERHRCWAREASAAVLGDDLVKEARSCGCELDVYISEMLLSHSSEEDVPCPHEKALNETRQVLDDVVEKRGGAEELVRLRTMTREVCAMIRAGNYTNAHEVRAWLLRALGEEDEASVSLIDKLEEIRERHSPRHQAGQPGEA